MKTLIKTIFILISGMILSGCVVVHDKYFDRYYDDNLYYYDFYYYDFPPLHHRHFDEPHFHHNNPPRR